MIGIKLVDSVKDLHYDQSINQSVNQSIRQSHFYIGL